MWLAAGAARAKHFGGARPGSATIIVKALVNPALLIEIEAVADDDVATYQRGNQNLLDIGEEQLAIDRSVEHAGRDQAILAQASNEGGGVPVPMRYCINQPVTHRGPAVEPDHVRLGPGLIDEDQPDPRPASAGYRAIPPGPWRRPVDPARRPGATFFERQAKQLQRVPDQPDARCDLVGRQQPRPQFRDRGIAPFGNIRADRCVERRQLRQLVAMLRAHGCLTRRAAPRQRLRHIRNAYPQQFGYLTNPLAIVRRAACVQQRIRGCRPDDLHGHTGWAGSILLGGR